MLPQPSNGIGNSTFKFEQTNWQAACRLRPEPTAEQSPRSPSSTEDRSAVERRQANWEQHFLAEVQYSQSPHNPDIGGQTFAIVLIKGITRLSTFNVECKFRTWLYRITANHVLNMKRRGGEVENQTFSSYADAINGTPDLDLPDPRAEICASTCQ